MAAAGLWTTASGLAKVGVELGAVIMLNSGEIEPMQEVMRAIALEYDWPDVFPKGNESVRSIQHPHHID